MSNNGNSGIFIAKNMLQGRYFEAIGTSESEARDALARGAAAQFHPKFSADHFVIKLVRDGATVEFREFGAVYINTDLGPDGEYGPKEKMNI